MLGVDVQTLRAWLRAMSLYAKYLMEREKK
jgi:hypothetical protein